MDSGNGTMTITVNECQKSWKKAVGIVFFWKIYIYLSITLPTKIAIILWNHVIWLENNTPDEITINQPHLHKQQLD